MQGKDFRAIRLSLGLTVRDFALALGYAGNSNTNSVLIRQMEAGDKPIPPRTERLALMYERHGVPPHWILENRVFETENG